MTKNPALSVESLKRFDRDPETITLRAAVLVGRKIAKETREKVDAYIATVFARFNFTDSRTGERIEKPGDLYRCTDEAACAEFYAACDEAHAANGFKTPGPGYCPALIAENEVAKAERALVRHAQLFIGVDFVSAKPDLYRKALELFLVSPAARPQSRPAALADGLAKADPRRRLC